MDSHREPRLVNVAIGLLVLTTCLLCAMVVAGSESLVEGVAGVAFLTIVGVLYAWMAVRAQLRAERLQDGNRLH